ncbi:MAG: glycosyltransferase involved in cell wall biosynthesis [Acidimicrobiales bacterium]|jgi:glycosyltransferase involved in cell wall biosynthesis
MAKEINVLAISYGRDLFDADNLERKRMEMCATTVGEYHMIVFTRRTDGLSVVHAQNGLIIHPTNSSTRIHMLYDAVRLGGALLKGRVGQWVITTQDPFEAGLVGYILSKRYKVALNMQEHADFFSNSFWRKESMLNRVRFILGKWLLRKADTVRVVSKRMESAMKRIGVAPEKILRLAVRTDVRATEDTTENIDLHTQHPEASVIILSMARFVPQKNLQMLIEAFSLVHKQNSQALLVLVGDGAEKQKLQELVTQKHLEKSVVFESWTDTPQAYMQSADIYALTSNYEGWARVLIEAMLSGTPVVTTDVGCAGEVLLDEKHGFVVPVGDTERFAQRLMELMNDGELRHRFASTGKSDGSEAHTTTEAYVQAWADVFAKTLG